MEMQTETRKRIANLTSNILNPFLLIMAMILLLSFTSASGTLDALKWGLILIAVGILPVFSTAIYLVRKGRLDSILTNVRQQRTRLYLLAVFCTAAGYIVLLRSNAPPMLEAAFATGFLALVIFMGINLWWKISLHTAFIAGLVTILVILYGWTAIVTVVLVALVAWARIELKYHSLAQATAGAILAVLIVIVVFYPFVRA